ncbi:uncharacterized protein O3C94_008485 [Discoglossus pictus]
MLTRLSIAGLLLLLTGVRAHFSCLHYNITAPLRGYALLPCPLADPMVPLNGSWKLSWLKQLEEEGVLSVHLQSGNQEVYRQSDVYVGRTRVRKDWIQLGDATLELQKVTSKDVGEYTCWVTPTSSGQHPSNTCVHVTLHLGTETGPRRDNICDVWIPLALFLICPIILWSISIAFRFDNN